MKLGNQDNKVEAPKNTTSTAVEKTAAAAPAPAKQVEKKVKPDRQGDYEREEDAIERSVMSQKVSGKKHKKAKKAEEWVDSKNEIETNNVDDESEKAQKEE